MTVIELPDEQAAALKAKATAAGLTLEDWLKDLAGSEDKPLAGQPLQTSAPGEPATGMVEENGLLVYRTGNPLPAQVVDDAVRRSREERSLYLLGNLP